MNEDDGRSVKGKINLFTFKVDKPLEWNVGVWALRAEAVEAG